MPEGKRFDPDSALAAYFREEIERERQAVGGDPHPALGEPLRPEICPVSAHRGTRRRSAARRTWVTEAAAAIVLAVVACVPFFSSPPKLEASIAAAYASGRMGEAVDGFAADILKVVVAGNAKERSGKPRGRYFN